MTVSVRAIEVIENALLLHVVVERSDVVKPVRDGEVVLDRSVCIPNYRKCVVTALSLNIEDTIIHTDALESNRVIGAEFHRAWKGVLKPVLGHLSCTV